MNTGLPPPPPAQTEPQTSGYQVLGVALSGADQALSRLARFAQGKGGKLGPVEHHDDVGTIQFPMHTGATYGTFMVIYAEATSGRLGKLRVAFITRRPHSSVSAVVTIRLTYSRVMQHQRGLWDGLSTDGQTATV